MRIRLEIPVEEGESEIHLGGGHAPAFIRVDGVEGEFDAGEMLRDVVPPVHEHVGHDVPEVDGGVDEGDCGGREGDQVAREARHGDGHDGVGAEGAA